MSREELEARKVSELKALADESGIQLKSTRKADIIDEILEGQKCMQTMNTTSGHILVIC